MPSDEWKFRKRGFPGMPYFSSRFRVKDFDVSRRARERVGPTAGMPAAARASTTPWLRGSSGPTTAKAAAASRAKATIASGSSYRPRRTSSEREAMPGLFVFMKE